MSSGSDAWNWNHGPSETLLQPQCPYEHASYRGGSSEADSRLICLQNRQDSFLKEHAHPKVHTDPSLWVRTALAGWDPNSPSTPTTPLPHSFPDRGAGRGLLQMKAIGNQEGWVLRGHTESLRPDISQASAIITNKPLYYCSYICRQ